MDLLVHISDLCSFGATTQYYKIYHVSMLAALFVTCGLLKDMSILWH